MLKHALAESGHTVVDAANALDAETLQIEHQFDVVLTDLIMPERDGFELLTAFRRRFPQVQIIAMSAGGQIAAPNYLKIAKTLGAAETLIKPVTEEQLEQAITRVLS